MLKKHKHISLSTSVKERFFANLSQPPDIVFFKGNYKILEQENTKFISVVGSRSPTPYGKEATDHLVNGLSGYPICVVSGLAYGIDTVALNMAVKAGLPTIAVLPGDVESIYPRSNEKLAQRIIDSGGLLLSEYRHCARPPKHHFIARNRLIASLGDCIVVPEARIKSGTAHTVAFGLALNKTVAAVPGSMFSELSRGTHEYIRAGAALVQSGDDLAELVGLYAKDRHQASGVPLGESQKRILLAIDSVKTTENELYQEFIDDFSVQEFSVMLTEMELKGIINRQGGRIFRAI